MKQCPICYEKLVVRDCTPCHDCGGHQQQAKLKKGLHVYNVYEIYDGLRLTLCDFCAVDFGSYKPEYPGLKKDQRLGFQHFQFVKPVEAPSVEKDGYCPGCEKRLKFLVFLAALRQKVKG